MTRGGDQGGRGRLQDVDTAVLVGGCLLSVVVTIWLTWGIWGPGIPNGDDTAAHVERARFAFDHLFSRGELDGWMPTFGVGYQEFLFVGPTFTFGVALVKLLSLGTISTLDAFKVMIVVSYVTLPLGVAFLAWSFRLGRRAAGLAAVLSLAVSSPQGGAGLAGVFETGLVPHQLASTFVCFAVGALVLVLRRPNRTRVVFAGAAVAGVIVTHAISTVALAFLAVAVLVSVGADQVLSRGVGDGVRGSTGGLRRRALGLGGAALLAGGFSAFVLLPMVVHSDLRGVSTAFADVPLTERAQEVWAGEFLFRPYVAAFVVAGVAYAVVRCLQGKRLALTLLFTPIVFLLLARLFIGRVPGNILALQLTNRASAYVGLLLVLPLAALVADLSHLIDRARVVPARAAAVAGAVVALAVVLVVVLLPPELGRERAGTVEPNADIEAAAQAIRDHVPEGARFATQRAPAAERRLTGLSHPDLWLAAVTQRNTLNIFNAESSSVLGPVFEPERLTEVPADIEANRLARLGVSHVLLLDTSRATSITNSSWFRRVWRRGPMALMEVVAKDGQPPPATLVSAGGPIEARLAEVEPERLVFDVDSPEATYATLAVAWSPKWAVTVDGAPVTITPDDDRLLRVPVPAGRSRIEIGYGPDGWDALGRAITLLTVVGVGFWGFTRRRARRLGRAAARATTAPPGGSVGDGSETATDAGTRVDDEAGGRRSHAVAET